jgi:hypothetical protein
MRNKLFSFIVLGLLKILNVDRIYQLVTFVDRSRVEEFVVDVD